MPHADQLRPAQLLAALLEHGVSFVVIGGFALAPHGYVRATKDIDIVPDPSSTNLARLAEALRELDAEVEVGELAAEEHDLVPDTAGLAGGGNWVLRTRFGRLDVMQDVPGLRGYARLYDEAISVNSVLYAGYDDLVSMKVASGRDEDLRDVAALRSARGE